MTTLTEFLDGKHFINDESKSSLATHSYAQTRELKNNILWNTLNQISLFEALILWTDKLNPHTSRSYKSSFIALDRLGILSLMTTLQEFSMLNHNVILDNIKQAKAVKKWSEGTKQVRAAAYISFTKFLYRYTEGIISPAIPCSQESCKTFFRVRDKVKTKAMSLLQTRMFLSSLKQINYRDWLIAQTLIQGAKRIGEVLSISTEQICFHRNTITFFQTKSRSLEVTTIINYPEYFMLNLKQYIGDRSGTVFITKNQKPVSLKQLSRTFSKAGEMSLIPFKVTPHVLRATSITEFKRMGCSDSDIMKVSGHTSSKMINAYDKTELSDNASKYAFLI